MLDLPDQDLDLYLVIDDTCKNLTAAPQYPCQRSSVYCRAKRRAKASCLLASSPGSLFLFRVGGGSVCPHICTQCRQSKRTS